MRSNGLTYEADYKGLPIQARLGFGLRTEILEVLRELFSQMTERFEIIAVVVLDIRVPPGGVSDGGHAIRRFMCRFAEYLRLQGVESEHAWVRKHPEYSSHPHYASALLLQVSCSQNLGLHLAHASALWAQENGTTQQDGLIHCCELDGAPSAVPVLVVRRDGLDFQGSCRRSFRALSRLAHVETSTDASDDAIEFGSSLPR